MFTRILKAFIVLAVHSVQANGPASCACTGCGTLNCNLATKLCMAFDGGVDCSNSTSSAICNIQSTSCTPVSVTECTAACAALGCSNTAWDCEGNKRGSCACDDCEPLECSNAATLCTGYDGSLDCVDSTSSLVCNGVDSVCGLYDDDLFDNSEEDCAASCTAVNCKISSFICV
jgi:hypothetical protein